MLNLSISICFIILLFLVPGALARKAYNSVKLSDYHNKASSLSEIVLTIALSIFIQFLGLLTTLLYDYLFYCPYRVDYHTILTILSLNANSNNEIFKPIEDHLMLIFFYQMTLYFLSAFLSRWFLGVVINYKLDQKYSFLRFDNEWHYILTGRVINPNKTVIKYANVLVDTDDDSFIIYSGVLTDYNINKDGDLRLIELKGVKKKVFKKSDLANPAEHLFKVDSFFIPYENIKNFSITYFNLDPVNEEKESLWKLFFKKAALTALLLIIVVSFLYFIFKLITLSDAFK